MDHPRPSASPMVSLWFGNFFEPFYSSADAAVAGIHDARDLGFTTVNLDSKPWEDFFSRYQGGAPSQYVGIHELMMQTARAAGLDYTCLALYLCGDNLYPTIRSVAPVRGEEAVRPNGEPMGTYKYWSREAQDSMVTHVQGLLRLYGAGMRRRPDGRIVMQTMFDPIPKPSFDQEGRDKYLTWLKGRYDGDVARLNVAYGLDAPSFDALSAEEYWLRPDELTWVGCALPTRQDLDRRTPDFHRWVDNQTHLADVLDEYLATMRSHWHALDPQLHAEPVLHQWGYFFNPPGAPDWQTGQRALDVYRCARHVDGVLFITSPLNPENRPDAMVVSAETAIARAANAWRDFTGGLYLGRHVNADVYRSVPPAEAVGTQVAGGATGLHVYGYSGLDDGGVLYKMDSTFRESLRTGIEWAKAVIPLIDEPREREVALLFPAEMSLLEPLQVDVGGRHRMDLLGWYEQFVDLGWNVDIVHPDQVLAGELDAYSHVVVPTNSLYDVGDNTALEARVRTWVERGGVLLHGPSCGLVAGAFGITEAEEDFDCLSWEEEIIPSGWSTVCYPGREAVATYIGSGNAAIATTPVGAGRVHSFGFEYGFAYCRTSMPIVPPQFGKREMHPVVLLSVTPVERLVGRSPRAAFTPVKGLEVARFGRHLVAVNHRSSPLRLAVPDGWTWQAQLPGPTGLLAAHSAVYLTSVATN